ncbi:sulfite exporter TauE/SafE family protein [Anaeromyxobacter oryzisoli]|uniref:sulfite exporter TauE/SafE family protein n=1 Tax=Anaeromyxobacter oryzisoli TaxID=2925408 RepID=UPI001F562219|nr:sulfite exporter TauE/SafE family protein [Anaeromyxobacter sp. SG63]
MTFAQGLFVTGASATAGLVNAVAGGGTLLTFPSLLLAGLSPVSANATSTVALWPGQISSVWAYRRHLGDERRRALVLGVPALLGGVIGATLLLALPERFFEAVVPWLILFACFLLALQNPIKRAIGRHAAGNHPAVLWMIQFFISIYGGYFGAGIGILMLAAMGILLSSSLQHANALKVLFALLSNASGFVLFLLSGKVDVHVAALMAVASLAGGFIGALVAQKLKPEAMRGFAILVGLVAAAKFLFR